MSFLFPLLTKTVIAAITLLFSVFSVLLPHSGMATVNVVSLFDDINPGSASSGARTFTIYNGAMYFVASDGVHGAELWRTDGTLEGTAMVKDINPGSSNG